MFFFFSAAYANPMDPVIVNGSANLISDENNLKIVASEDLILHWKTFSIDKNEKVSFIQPSENSFVLNRVVGIEKSLILGDLLSNGKVFLLNPNGILIGKDAKIDTTSFVASTLNLKDSDFLNKENLNFLGDSEESIINLGSIKTSKDVYVISRSIENKGTIDANGKVLLGCSDSVLIKPDERTSLYILSEINENSKERIGLALSGNINASQIEIKANGNLYDLAINLTGNIDATSLSEENGEIYLKADFGDINILDSNITASKKSGGGKIEITAENINIDGIAKIDVSNDQDGGCIYIGGGKQGRNPLIKNAATNFIGENVIIDASSSKNGNGGEIIVWAEEETEFHGKIFSNGGINSGNGGFAEVSGLKNLIYEGIADLRAESGIMGTLLLDPYDVTIGTALADTNISYDGASPTNTATPTNTLAVVGLTNLNTNLNTANVDISTFNAIGAEAGTITVNLSAGSIAPASTAHGNLTLRATSNILFATSAANSITFLNPSSSFNAIAGDPTIGGVNGDIQFNGTTFTLNFPSSSTGAANFTANGTGIVTTAAAAAVKTITFSNVPIINFNGNGGITIANNLITNATNVNFGNASIVNLNANGPITFGNNGAAPTTVQASASTILNVSANGATGSITFAKSAASATNALFFTNFSSINFSADSTITNTPTALQTITFTNVPVIDFEAVNGIIIGNNNTANSTNINFPNTSVFNITTTGAAADIIFGCTAGGSGSTTLTGGSATDLSALSARDILFTGGTGSYAFSTFSSLDFDANNNIAYSPHGNFTSTFSFIDTIDYVAELGEILIGQNSTAFTTTINYGNTNLINMSTAGVSQNITFGGTGTGALTITANSSTTLNVNPTGAINFTGSAGITAINTFNTINLFSSASVPASNNLINFSRPTITFNGITNLMMYPYNIAVSASNTVTNILSSTTLALIKTIDPLGTTIPATLQINTNFSNFDLQAQNLTINGRILNANNGYIYLTSENDILVEATNASGARVGTMQGDVKINCPNDLTVKAGNTANFVANIGQQTVATASIDSDIYLTVGRDVNILGGNATVTGNDFALIGHGSKSPSNPSIMRGDIIINSIGRNLNIIGGGTLATPAIEGVAKMGNGALDVSTVGAVVNVSGDIRGLTPGSRAIIGGDINIIGGVGDQCKAVLGHTGSNISNGSVTLDGNILLQCNNLNMTTQPSTAAFEMYSGLGHKIRYTVSGLSSIITGSVDVKVLDDLQIDAKGFGGSVFIGAYINNSGANTSTGDIDFSLINLEVGGFMSALGGTTAGPQENKVIIGVFSDYVANYTRANLNIKTGIGLDLISRTGDNCFIINGQTPTLGRTMDINIGGDLHLWGQNKSCGIRAIDTLNLTLERDLNMVNSSSSIVDYTSIESQNNMNISVGKSLQITGFGINVGPLSDPGYAIIRNNSLLNGDINLIVNANFKIHPYTKIQNLALGKAVTVVCDNSSPNPWEKGEYAITMHHNTSISTNSGPLRLFTVDQSLNNIFDIPPNYATLNGEQFVPGTEFVDTATEVWGVYYPSSIGGVPFTIFYKTFPFITIDTILQRNNDFFIPFFEMFYRSFARFFDINFEKCSEKQGSVCFY